MDFEEFCETYEDDIYIEYMETGTYYELDVDLERFSEWKYDEFLTGDWP